MVCWVIYLHFYKAGVFLSVGISCSHFYHAIPGMSRACVETSHVWTNWWSCKGDSLSAFAFGRNTWNWRTLVWCCVTEVYFIQHLSCDVLSIAPVLWAIPVRVNKNTSTHFLRLVFAFFLTILVISLAWPLWVRLALLRDLAIFLSFLSTRLVMGFSKQSAGREIESKNIPRVMSSMKGDSCTGTLRLSQGVKSQQSHLSIDYTI